MNGWAATFAEAAAVGVAEGCEADNEFFLRSNTNSSQGAQETGTTDADNNVNRVSELARSYLLTSRTTKNGKKRPRQECSPINDDGVSSMKKQDINDDDVSVEGVLHENEIVLLDRKNRRVFSSSERTNVGGYVEIGKLDEDGGVKLFDQGANKDVKFPYPTSSDDHCETPLEAYSDIKIILKKIAKKLCTENKKKSKHLAIYDPYFCNGSMVEKLNSLGFRNVYNKMEDCYSVWKKNSTPDFDVLVTNPPYSGDHIEKLMKYVTGDALGERPWLLLMPEWVHKKDYFLQCIGKKCRPLYLVPKKRYVYLPPPGFREKTSSDTHKKSSPFTSYWYIWGGSQDRTDLLAEYFSEKSDGKCMSARSKNGLRDLRRMNKNN
mmetsp:Transcript_8288/g.12328  ORF Transcript_8288/g.12328 Transcript_8288/m.12328 type:complete len:378 (-) Transcript_8288:2-1135(-)